jgi:hypothetical protein
MSSAPTKKARRVEEQLAASGGTEPPSLADQAKAIVSFAFRNGPLEDIHADSHPGGSGVSDAEMKALMIFAVDQVFWLLRLRDELPSCFKAMVAVGNEYTPGWNDPGDAPPLYAPFFQGPNGERT